MTAWYNEPDPYAAAWLRNLIAADLIAPGVVDERKIQDVEAWELAGYTQCHFFAGIGIWSAALRAAGWPDDAPIWTGSCPCQPFSNAGKRKGTDDERHLWPYWFPLIEICKPAIVVGEQVASKDGLGWLDLVSSDMENAGYAIGAVDLCAAGFGQAHIRQRLYFVGMADAYGKQIKSTNPRRFPPKFGCASANGGLGIADGARSFERQQRSEAARRRNSFIAASGARGLEHGVRTGREERGSRAGDRPVAWSGFDAARPVLHSRQAGSLDNADWLLCRNPSGEPSWRPIESGTFPLAHGVADRMGKLRAYGNGLDFQTAQGFCEVVAEIAGIRSVAEFDL